MSLFLKYFTIELTSLLVVAPTVLFSPGMRSLVRHNAVHDITCVYQIYSCVFLGAFFQRVETVPGCR